MSVSPIPDGFHSLTPYLVVQDAAKAIDFYTRAFGAVETMRLSGPGDSVIHAEMKIGSSMFMLADEAPQQGALSPKSVGGSPVGLCLYIEDVDQQVEVAIEAGATVERPIQDQFYGDRSATLRDPYGHQWTLATHIEDLSQEDIENRMAQMFAGGDK